MATAEMRESIYNSVAVLGARLVLGAIFIAHGLPKLNPGFENAMAGMGLPLELQYPVIIIEVLGGALLIAGVLSRISAAFISALLVGAIFHIHGTTALTGDEGIEFQLMLLAVSLMLMVLGPSRMSVSHAIKRIPRPIH